jgi:hypothetical protein
MTRPSAKPYSVPANRRAVFGLDVRPSFEDKLAREPEWAMSEASQFFEGKGAVQATLRKVTQKLHELRIDYAVVGGMALFKYGYRRFTEDIDILVTRDGLKEIHRNLDGLGYLPPFQGSKNLRDTETGVKIEFLIAGEFPGDGRQKPVAFPVPDSVASEVDGIQYINLPALVELKLASGMTSPERMKDLSDVLELIRVLDLPAGFAAQLNPFVREKYEELRKDAHPTAKRYVTVWRNKWLTAEAKSLKDMADGLQSAADLLRSMLADGVFLDPDGGTSDDHVYLVTTDPAIAKKYDMHDEKEIWDQTDEEEDADETRPGSGQPPAGN